MQFTRYPRRPARPYARVLAPTVAVIMLVGFGALGWLAAHVLTYDALGVSNLHAGHEYMRPVGEGGAGLAMLGFTLAVLVLVVARRPFVRWLRGSIRGPRRDLAYLLAALVPAASFLLVEMAEGATAGAGELVLLIGMPLQALLGMVVLWLVRELLEVIADVADWLDHGARYSVYTPVSLMASPLSIPMLRRCPMAASAPRRGPPRR